MRGRGREGEGWGRGHQSHTHRHTQTHRHTHTVSLSLSLSLSLTLYIAHFKTWLNLFFPDQVGTKNLNWFVFNQNKVLLTLLNGRNERKNALETVRKDINLMLHFLEIAAAPKEIITKYKLFNKNLSLIHEQKESENKLDEGEQKNLLIIMTY